VPFLLWPSLRVERKLARGTQNSNFGLGRNYKTSVPFVDFLVLKDFANPKKECLSIGRAKADKQNATMRPRREPSNVREIHILRDEESRLLLRRIPNFAVAPATGALVGDRVNIMVEIG
jgi:hypothetical protein